MIRSFDQKKPLVPSSAFVDDTALLIGDVTLGEQASIWPMAVLRGDIHRIEIGDRTNIQDSCVIHVTHASDMNPEGFPTIIGQEVIVGHRVVLHGCRVEDNCLIGIGSIIMDGALIHSNVIVGAGSLVPPNKELEGGYLWMGSPVQKIRKITEKEYQFLRYSANYYVKLQEKHARQR